ncbi:MAG TPA: hypothetical protein VD865_14720 [Stenotrophomonas sp.]|nr:hypothetical protein [Stenotrophomonas sp.]
MGAGLRVISQDGSNAFQIDDNYQNLFLRHKGTIATTLVSNPTYNTTYTVAVTVSGCRGVPMIASRCGVPCHSYAGPTGTPGEYLISFIVMGPLGTVIDYYVFDVLGTDEGSNFGIKVWNAAGQLQFDAGKKPMRVVDYFADQETGPRTYPSGRTYAVALAGGGGSNSLSGGGGAGYVILTSGAVVAGNVVQATFFQILGGSGGGTNMRQTFFALVLDVTNY